MQFVLIELVGREAGQGQAAVGSHRVVVVPPALMTTAASLRDLNHSSVRHTCQAFIKLASPVVGRRIHPVAKLIEDWEICANSVALLHDPQSVAVQTFLFTLCHICASMTCVVSSKNRRRICWPTMRTRINLISFPGGGGMFRAVQNNCMPALSSTGILS